MNNKNKEDVKLAILKTLYLRLVAEAAADFMVAYNSDLQGDTREVATRELVSSLLQIYDELCEANKLSRRLVDKMKKEGS